jgi:exodeoxyribonuclease V alpha subunit
VRWIADKCKQPSRWARQLVISGQDQPSEHQLQAYTVATQAAVGVLAGSPGTGKTWLTGRMIDTIQQRGDSFAVCAPTGKAALRVMESLKLQGVTVMATTIHKLLEATVGKDGWEFTYNADYKLPYDFIIVDESSMIDIVLLKSLLDAIKDGANVLFVGDHEQLPPVGKGAPLRDMIKCGVPCGQLTEIRRNAGEIVKACAAIRDKQPIGQIPSHFEADDNLIFCRMTPEPERVFNTIKSIVAFEQAHNESFDPLLDCQIIVPLNEASPLSRKQLNPLLQEHFNLLVIRNLETLEKLNANIGAETPLPFSKIQQFRRGEKIICNKNGWANGVYIANGEICRVQDFSASQLDITVNGQSVAVPTYNEWGESNFELGYCISGHKSQGSQWQVVIVLLDPAFGAGMVCDRHWLYTTISRAMRRCYLIGMTSTLDEMKGKSNMWNRLTLFTEQFYELRKEETQ